MADLGWQGGELRRQHPCGEELSEAPRIPTGVPVHQLVALPVAVLVHRRWAGDLRRDQLVQSFVRLANALGADDPAGLAPLVRTKVLVLGWAYDYLYGERFLQKVARKPQSFGRLELPDLAR